MATRVQFRRGTTAEHSSFTGAVGEVTVDTTKKVIVVHDGSTAGGVPSADMTTDTAQTVTGIKTHTKPARGGVQALTTSSNTVAVDFALSNFYTLEVTEATTIANPTNAVAGQAGSIFINQNATGNYAVSWGTNWKFAGGSPPTITVTANAISRVDYIVRGASEIHAVASLDIKRT